MIEKNFPEYKDVIKIGTPESHQGQEYYITCLSAVRTDRNQLKNDEASNLGFVTCKERINVAISRARSLLMIYGKADVLSENENWRKLIQSCKDNATYKKIFRRK